jgi:hypothetical protein
VSYSPYSLPFSWPSTRCVQFIILFPLDSSLPPPFLICSVLPLDFAIFAFSRLYTWMPTPQHLPTHWFARTYLTCFPYIMKLILPATCSSLPKLQEHTPPKDQQGINNQHCHVPEDYNLQNTTYQTTSEGKWKLFCNLKKLWNIFFQPELITGKDKGNMGIIVT